MSEPVGWPSAVRRAVDDVIGTVRSVERLSGLSGREVVRADGDTGSVVVKARADPRELSFYSDVAPSLSDVPVPRLHWGDGTHGAAWLVLEHVPRPLPRDRWTGPEVYDVLAALHTDVSAFGALTQPFRPRWTDAMTEQASGTIGVDLSAYHDEAGAWLLGTTPISGDPNPRNWRVRADGTVVLLDWERAGRSTAAVDVAIALPGLPTIEETTIAAAAYGEARRQRGAPLADVVLPRSLLVLKLWSAVELLCEDRDDDALRDVRAWLIDALPAWLRSWPRP